MANTLVKQLLHTTITLWDDPHFYVRVYNMQPTVYDLIESTFNDTLFEYAVLTGDSSYILRSSVVVPKHKNELQVLDVRDRKIVQNVLELSNPKGDYSTWRQWIAKRKELLLDTTVFPTYQDTQRVKSHNPAILKFHTNRKEVEGTKIKVNFNANNMLEMILINQSHTQPESLYRFLTEYEITNVKGPVARKYVMRSYLN